MSVLKKGFTLIELILVLSVGVMASFIKFQDMKNEQDQRTASAAGEQIQRIGYAVNNYIALRYDKLSTLTSSSSQSSDPGPRTCAGTTCTINIQTLKNEGILPNSYVDNNAFKSSYSIVIKRIGTSPNYTLDALITTNASWIENSNVRYDLLGYAMQKAGVDSGVTKSTTRADGYNAIWSENSSSFNNIVKEGQLAFRAGYNSSLYSAFLRRDGTLPMTGNLNMGDNDIYNAKDITASGTGDFGGDIKAAGTITAGKEVVAHNGYGDTIRFGGDASTDDYEITMVKDKPLSIHMASNRADLTTLKITGNTSASGRIDASGNITSAALVSGQYLQPTSVANIGDVCPSVGYISKDPSGKILSCKNGFWRSVSDFPAGSPIPWPSNTLPQGWLICNGQSFNKTLYPELAKAYPSGVLPDLRGVFIRGNDNGRGLDAGRALGSYQDDALQKITGSFPVANRWRGYFNGSFRTIGNWNTNYKNGNSDDWGKQVQFDSSYTTRSANETRPKNVAFNYIVKAE